ncbi:MAG: DNA-deoxyinosine glycosylase [Oscillospiraceae bacterium]|nr:MAG: DNA-deoxyinosine glycosylase [Oscillospiraceae bacterium]
MQQVHPIPPVFDADSTVLVLGSFPSVKSRESGFFYGHAQNRFWRVTAAVFGCPVPVTIPEKRAFLLQNHVALWDVIASCDIDGSSDASIKNVRPNDLAPLLAASKITHIFTNGATADALYTRWQFPATGISAVRLPSTSPANAAWSLDRLIDAWRVIR